MTVLGSATGSRQVYFHDDSAPPATVVTPSVFVAVRRGEDRLLLVRRCDSGAWELPVERRRRGDGSPGRRAGGGGGGRPGGRRDQLSSVLATRGTSSVRGTARSGSSSPWSSGRRRWAARRTRTCTRRATPPGWRSPISLSCSSSHRSGSGSPPPWRSRPSRGSLERSDARPDAGGRRRSGNPAGRSGSTRRVPAPAGTRGSRSGRRAPGPTAVRRAPPPGARRGRPVGSGEHGCGHGDLPGVGACRSTF